MNPALYRLTPLRPPVPVLEPGTYLYADESERLEVELRESIRPRQLARVIRQIPHARDVAA